MKLNRFLAATVVLAALQTTGAWAQVGDPNISKRDARFLQQAAQSALLQFALGQLAMGSGPTQELRDYGLQLAADYGTPGSHFGINGELAGVAENHGVALPTTLTRSQQRQLDRLTALAATDNTNRFVRTFVAQSISLDRSTVKLYQKEANQGQGADTSQLAQNILPMVQRHLDQAVALRSKH